MLDRCPSEAVGSLKRAHLRPRRAAEARSWPTPVEAKKSRAHSAVDLITQRWPGALTASLLRAYGLNVNI
jgi:hypothetical protein